MYSVSSYCSLLDNNELLVGFSPEINELKMLSEYQVDEKQLTNTAETPACKGKSFTWYVIDQLKGGLHFSLSHISSALVFYILSCANFM